MTREELVKAIYASCDDWSCPDDDHCEKVEYGDPRILCKECADKLLEEYEGKIRADGYHKAENDYFAKTQKDRENAYNCGYEIGKADAIEAFKSAILSQFCARCDQEACEGGCAGSIQQCYVAANLAEVTNDIAGQLKGAEG